MLTTENYGSVRATEKVAMFLINGVLYGRQWVKLKLLHLYFTSVAIV